MIEILYEALPSDEQLEFGLTKYAILAFSQEPP